MPTIGGFKVQLVAAAAHSVVPTLMRLALERQRKNDRIDAVELCARRGEHGRTQADPDSLGGGIGTPVDGKMVPDYA